MTSIPKRISASWLRQQKTKLDCTMPASPMHAELEAEIASAETEIARRNAFEAWVKQEKGAVLNQYPLRTATQTYEPGKVFVHKDKSTGKTTFWTLEKAWELYQAATGQSE